MMDVAAVMARCRLPWSNSLLLQARGEFPLPVPNTNGNVYDLAAIEDWERERAKDIWAELGK
jgi:hypothetical protein